MDKVEHTAMDPAAQPILAKMPSSQ